MAKFIVFSQIHHTLIHFYFFTGMHNNKWYMTISILSNIIVLNYQHRSELADTGIRNNIRTFLLCFLFFCFFKKQYTLLFLLVRKNIKHFHVFFTVYYVLIQVELYVDLYIISIMLYFEKNLIEIEK